MLALGPVAVSALALAVTTPGFVRLQGTSPRAGDGDARLMTYSVDLERALGLDPAAVTAEVDAALAHPRGWTRTGAVAFRRVDSGADTRVIVARPATTDGLCAPLATLGRWSCAQGRDVVLNGERWEHAVPHWRAGRARYRQMLVNHEMGHRLGLGHASCPGPGRRAPVMVQQSKALGGCRAGWWPQGAEISRLK